MKSLLQSVAVVALGTLALPALAADMDGKSPEELLDAAKAEGQVVVYSFTSRDQEGRSGLRRGLSRHRSRRLRHFLHRADHAAAGGASGRRFQCRCRLHFRCAGGLRQAAGRGHHRAIRAAAGGRPGAGRVQEPAAGPAPFHQGSDVQRGGPSGRAAGQQPLGADHRALEGPGWSWSTPCSVATIWT